MSKKNFSELSLEERQKYLLSMSDEDIDFTDIPEIDDDFLPTLKRIEPPQILATNTVRIKPELINWLKDHAQGQSCEVLINNILEKYIQHQVKS